ncbi:glycosyltransferase [Chryseobacterium proteolyticum]
MYLNIPSELPFISRFSFIIKTKIINLLKGNTDYWVVQNKNVKLKLSEKFKINQNKIWDLPFYPSMKGEGEFERNDFGFIYVSHPFLHKNHLKLIDAFCLFYDKMKKGELTLTIDDSYTELNDYINTKIALGYPIKNIGFIKRDELYTYYQSNRYLIFPSLTESFGLGIIEALENGCDIIGSDLPYMHDVCTPSVVFDPNSIQSIADALNKSIVFQNIKRSESKVKDEIETLIYRLNK